MRAELVLNALEQAYGHLLKMHFFRDCGVSSVLQSSGITYTLRSARGASLHSRKNDYLRIVKTKAHSSSKPRYWMVGRKGVDSSAPGRIGRVGGGVGLQLTSAAPTTYKLRAQRPQ